MNSSLTLNNKLYLSFRIAYYSVCTGNKDLARETHLLPLYYLALESIMNISFEVLAFNPRLANGLVFMCSSLLVIFERTGLNFCKAACGEKTVG